MSMRELTVGDVPVRALRVTFVGELGWELYCPSEYGAGLWAALWEAGRPHGLVAGGYRAIDSPRLEKGYRVWGTDITYLLSAVLRRAALTAIGAPASLASRRDVARRRRIDRVRRRQDARSASASACSAAPPSTSRSPPASSPTCAWSARSATTSATTSTTCCASRGVDTDDIEHVAGRQDLLLARPLRVRPQRRPHRRHPAQRLRRVRAEALRRLARGGHALPRQHPARPPARRCARSATGAELGGARLDEPLDRHRARLAACRRSARSTACSSTTPSCACSPGSRTSPAPPAR